MKSSPNATQAAIAEKTALYHGIRDVLLSARNQARQAILPLFSQEEICNTACSKLTWSHSPPQEALSR